MNKTYSMISRVMTLKSLMASVCKACEGRVVRGVDRASLLKHNMGCLHT